jgi:hypothetical protein
MSGFVSAPLATNWFGWQHYLPLDDNLNRKLKDSVEEAYCIGWPAGRKIIARWLHTATHHDVRIIVEPFWHNFFHRSSIPRLVSRRAAQPWSAALVLLRKRELLGPVVR